VDKITVKDIEVSYKKVNQEDYICLTDMAKFDDPFKTGYVISRWLSSRYTIEFIGIWEKVYNPNFNVVEFYNIKNESGAHNYVLTAKQWIESTNAIGIISNAGRYGGTYAHRDIAFEFATWLSAEFKFWIITEFQRLKIAEQKQLQWSAKRELAKVNYHLQTQAITEHIIVPELTEKQKLFAYTDEADLLNVVLFGKTAKEWREQNPKIDHTKENMRDYATMHQLFVLSYMEQFNSYMISKKIPQAERMTELSKMARTQLENLGEADKRLLLTNGKK